jgi:serine/threonine protein phosphatase PrpC
MKSALLRGREHTRLGTTAAIAEGRAAIALSRGGAPKRYRHRDPNEDAALFAEGPGGVLLAVADGHGGSEAAEAALEHLLEHCAPVWTAAEAGELRKAWPDDARRALGAANAAILARVARGGPDSARTTLSLALARPGDDWLGWAALGDSHVFSFAGGEVVELGHEPERRSFFLGIASDTEQTLAEKHVAGSQPLGATRALVLVTDGLSEEGIGVAVPEDAVAECLTAAERLAPHLRPLETARGLVERALAAHAKQRAGDNVGAATLWI